MAIAFVSKNSSNGSTASTSTVNAPASIVAGNVLLMAVGTTGSPSAAVLPSGWAFIDGAADFVVNSNIAILTAWKIATGSEPGSYTVTWTGGGVATVNIIAQYSGNDQTSPIDAHGTTNGTASASVVSPTLTPTRTPDWRVDFYLARVAPGTVTVPGSQTSRATDGVDAATDATMTLGDEALSGLSATGTRTATASSAVNNIGAGILIKVALNAGNSFFWCM
jgi:hypothetical protein